MKKIIIAAIIALFAIASCNKDQLHSQSESQISLNLNINTSPDTKAVKTCWEAGDWMYLKIADKHIRIQYNGSKWIPADEDAITSLNSITEPSGSLYAVYVMGAESFLLKSYPDTYNFNTLEITPCIKGESLSSKAEATYTLSESVLSANITLYQLGSQVTITGLTNEEDWTLSGSFTGSSMLSFNTERGFDMYAKLVDALSYTNADGIAFYGKMGEGQTLRLTNQVSGIVYTLTLPEDKKIEIGKAYKIKGPSLDEYGDIVSANGWNQIAATNNVITFTSPVTLDTELNRKRATIFKQKYVKYEYSDGSGKVIYPSTITSVPDSAFYVCIDMTSATLPSTVKRIGNNSFVGCSSLNTINLDNIESIGERGLRGTAITSINSSKLKSVGKYGLSYNQYLEEVNCPNLYTLQQHSFTKCPKLSTVTISSYDISTFPANLFDGCTELSTINIPLSLEIIESSAFKDCVNLSKMPLENTELRIIGNNAFNGSGLRSIRLPFSITSIGASAFANLSSTNFKLDCTNVLTPPTLGAGALNTGVYLFSIIVPYGYIEVYENAEGWSDWSDKLIANL